MKRAMFSLFFVVALVFTSVPQAFAANDTFTSASVDRDNTQKYSSYIFGQNKYGRFTLQSVEGGGEIYAVVQQYDDKNGEWNDIAFLSINITEDVNKKSTNVYMAKNKQYRLKVNWVGLSGTAYLRSYD